MRKSIITLKNRKPSKNLFVVFMLFLQFPLYIPGIKWIVRNNLKHCSNISFIPGFKYYYGNIYADNVGFGNAILMDYASIYIGKGTNFGYESMILTAYHDPKSWNTVHAKTVHIGKNVMIYARSIILGGVTIGDNSIIGAGSVVTKNIPANVFAAGNPTKVIKKLK